MSEPFLGEIRMTGFNFAPRGWAFCNGQIMSIASNTALFSLLGTTYGGNGQTTFALPDLRSRVPVHQGQGPGLSSRFLGEASGEEAVTLTSNQMPAHTHPLNASSTDGTIANPSGKFNAVTYDSNTLNELNTYGTAPNVTMSATAIGTVGGSQPHDNMPPYLCVSFIIALEGIFPSRN